MRVIVIIDCSYKDAIDILRKKYKLSAITKKPNAFHNASSEILINGEHINFFIWQEKFEWNVEDIAILNHEIFHHTILVLNALGIKITAGQSEPGAYYNEYVLTKCLMKLSKYKKSRT